MAEHHVIRLEDKYGERRPPEGTVEQGLFDLAIMGLREMNGLAKPFLRGFDVLNALRPIFPEIGKNAIVDTQRVHRLNTDTSPFGTAIEYVLIHGEKQAKNKITDGTVIHELDSAIRYVHYLERNLKKPDTDFELNEFTVITPEQLAREWEKIMAQPTCVILSSNEHEYGYRGKVIRPRQGIEIFSLEIGPLHNVRNSRGVLRVDWTAGAHRNESIFDLRWGPYGLQPTDGLRAMPITDAPLVFRIDESSITFPQISDASSHPRDGIRFPRIQKVLGDPYRYLELASRGIMQSIWHSLILEMPRSVPLINWHELQEHYKKYPRQRLAFIDKIVDAFMVDPKKAFQLCTQLGIWKTSGIFSGLDEKQMAKILDILPERANHFQNLISDPNGYSVFELLISAMYEVIPRHTIDPKKDMMVLYEDIFPSGKE